VSCRTAFPLIVHLQSRLQSAFLLRQVLDPVVIARLKFKNGSLTFTCSHHKPKFLVDQFQGASWELALEPLSSWVWVALALLRQVRLGSPQIESRGLVGSAFPPRRAGLTARRPPSAKLATALTEGCLSQSPRDAHQRSIGESKSVKERTAGLKINTP
jgi:hypothetical protein